MDKKTFHHTVTSCNKRSHTHNKNKREDMKSDSGNGRIHAITKQMQCIQKREMHAVKSED